MFSNLEERFQQEAKIRTQKDIASRSLQGVAIYLFVWFLGFVPLLWNNTESSPNLILLTIVMVIAALIRVWLVNRFHARSETEQGNHFHLLLLGVVVTGGAWGLISAYLLANFNTDKITFLVLFTIAGLGAGGTLGLAPSRRMVLFHLASLLIPIAWVMCNNSSAHAMSTAYILSLFTAGMLYLSKLQRDEYFSSLYNHYCITQYAEEMSDRSTRDPLTQLKNRGYFEDNLEYAFNGAVRDKTVISMILLDLDYFKLINDRYGHIAGDQCLVATAKLLNKVLCRSTDIITRYGGEEFAIVLPRTTADQAHELANRVREELEHSINQYNNEDIPLTGSIGVSTMWPKPGDHQKYLVQSADEALYKAKDEGRNRVYASLEQAGVLQLVGA